MIGKMMSMGFELATMPARLTWRSARAMSMSAAEFQQFSELIKDDVFAVLKLEGSVLARNHVGSTSPEQVKAQVSRLKKLI